MGKGDHVLVLDQIAIFGGFLFPDVDSGGRNGPAVQSFQEGFFADGPTAGTVDEEGPLLHLLELRFSERWPFGLNERNVKADEIALRKEFLEGNHVDEPQGSGLHELVEPDNLHSKSLCAGGKGLSDPAHAYQAQSLPVEFASFEGFLVPFPVLHRYVRPSHLPGQGEHEAECEFGDGYRRTLRGVPDLDVLLLRRHLVDIVEADTGPGDEAEVLSRLDDRTGDLRGGTDHNGVIGGNLFDQVFGGHLGLVDDLQIWLRLQFLHGLRIHGIGNEDFGFVRHIKTNLSDIP